MSHFFYSDPLAAAWMASRYEMVFCTATGEIIDRWVIDSLISTTRNNPEGVSGKYTKLFVHHDSLFLLEPILNDVIWTVREGFYEVQRICDVYDLPVHNTWALHRIAERNGIPFMWPEQEAA
ncbi:hypothetical protein GobsT_51300 [Gemmata obscuriglobus]|uniref:Uncharacterized protein n=1 Tax=Gemmata obscuriglobus TaxID=114 RepID=A0A2Z3GZR6_9BACT|nr:hypothetical protein [Gemmata obscuriglobus]AWM36987.1 hypothetical protein C1280_08105 [Gemmata obscuriglobus]QEG30325.1 hypothetical protein GobsT_51300 [Gemmata obscuriglobus]VTS09649.1 unnamed protein product [Gemmata obscuriglobus UQM 2246]